MIHRLTRSVPSQCLFALVVALLVAATPGCHSKSESESDSTEANGTPKVTVYTSVDEDFAKKVLDTFQSDSGVQTEVVFDNEAGKTTGLVKRIRAEAQSGGKTADVFWSSELFGTMELAKDGLLEPYDSPLAADIPARFRDPQRRWTAVAARGRVLAFDPTKVDLTKLPTKWEQLAQPEYAKDTTFANPLFGTTRGHVAAMFALWGKDKARKYLTDLRDGGMLLSDGNSAAVRAVVGGRAKYAATDTDDVWVAQQAKESVGFRFLDMGDGGALMIPCSVAMIKGTKHGYAARKLVDFLVSARVESMLAKSRSHNAPVRPKLQATLEMKWPPETKVSYQDIANALPESDKAVREILIK